VPGRSRPSHADQLHLDLWIGGKNIACDAGTYLYTGEGIWRNGLSHTAVHNTVTVDDQDQMKMVSRFNWTKWAKGNVLQHDENIWQGEHDGYRRLADPVNHRRTVLSLGEDRWLVVDHLIARRPHHYALHWLLHDLPYEETENSVLLAMGSVKYKVEVGLVHGTCAFSILRADSKSTRGWRSRYYAYKEPALSVLLETDQPRACFWTFFGFEEDAVDTRGHELNIRFDGRETAISLAELSKLASYKPPLSTLYSFQAQTSSPKQSASRTCRRRSSMANE
jgi:asparagine synthase (glutamine-hydrolysing)